MKVYVVYCYVCTYTITTRFGVYDTIIPNYSARKNAEDLKKNLENVVVPMFCNASIGNIFIIMSKI